MLLLYLYFVLWILGLWVNIAFLIGAIGLSIFVGITLSKSKGISNGMNIFISALVFMGITHMGFLLGLITIKIEDNEIIVNDSKIKKRMFIK